jgi:hypothetical protein
MKKPKAKPESKTSTVFGRLITNMLAISSLVTWLVFGILVVCGMVQRATVKLGFEKGWVWPTLEVTLEPQRHAGGDRKVPPLGSIIEERMVSKHLYDLEVKKREESEKTLLELKAKVEKGTVEISRLPLNVQGSPEEVVVKVGRIVEYCDTIWYRCGVIATEVAQNVSIDTNGPAKDESAEETFKCLGICLNKIGYTGLLEGDWRRMNNAVLDFQKTYCPPADGKVGIKTWLAMFVKLAQEMSGEEVSR